MKLSIIVSIFNSHEIVRRQFLHYERLGLPPDVEILFMDDSSDPPLEYNGPLKNIKIIPVNNPKPHLIEDKMFADGRVSIAEIWALNSLIVRTC